MGDRPLAVEVLGVPAGGRALAAWLTGVAPGRARGGVTVAVTTDARVRALNRRFRGVDQATDVLSFPAGEPGELGDIVIARGVASRQARDLGHPLSTELKVLALHGLLHLLGYDHEADDGRMARTEARLRRRGGLAAGLIERSLSRRIAPEPRQP
jgi:probable rRNA maturation factor